MARSGTIENHDKNIAVLNAMQIFSYEIIGKTRRLCRIHNLEDFIFS